MTILIVLADGIATTTTYYLYLDTNKYFATIFSDQMM